MSVMLPFAGHARVYVAFDVLFRLLKALKWVLSFSLVSLSMSIVILSTF